MIQKEVLCCNSKEPLHIVVALKLAITMFVVALKLAIGGSQACK